MTDEKTETPRDRINARIEKGSASTDYRDVKAAQELADIVALIDGKADKPEPAPEPALNLSGSGDQGGATSSGFGGDKPSGV
jgi:hypothetical protein